jgi:voltage-gated potassium channel
MGAFALQPHVAEFSHVVMHDETLDYRIEEVEVSPASPLAGRTLAEAGLAAATGSLLMALRSPTGQFVAHPTMEQRLDPGTIVIALGTAPQLDALRREVRQSEGIYSP